MSDGNRDRREAARAAGERYGAMAADLSLMRVDWAADEDIMEEHVQGAGTQHPRAGTAAGE